MIEKPFQSVRQLVNCSEPRLTSLLTPIRVFAPSIGTRSTYCEVRELLDFHLATLHR